jgi:UDP:flavonoid glycosyltransferase YjiC (YdhE family)
VTPVANIVIGCVPIEGHISPLLSVARHLVARGDTVTVLSGSRFADRVERAGARHVPLPAEADFNDRDVNASFPGRADQRGLGALVFDIEHLFTRPARYQYEALMGLAEGADAILVDPTFAAGAYYASVDPSQRPPIVVGGVLPLAFTSPDTAPFGMGLPPTRFFNRSRNRILDVVSNRVMARAQAIAEETHLELLGTPLPGRAFDWMRRADAIAQFTVAGFEYPRGNAPDNLRFVGPLPAPVRSELPDWWAELDSGRPIVHVTQGTIANVDFGQLIVPVLEAMADRDVLVVVATGGRPISELPPLPTNARAAEFLPYDEFLPKIDVYVTNGGYGGVNLALRHGAPIVVTGGKEDKPEVGARIAWAGVGRRLRAERPSARVVGRAIDGVLSEPGYRARAQQFAAAMADTDALAGVAQVIDDAIAASQREGRQG